MYRNLYFDISNTVDQLTAMKTLPFDNGDGKKYSIVNAYKWYDFIRSGKIKSMSKTPHQAFTHLLSFAFTEINKHIQKKYYDRDVSEIVSFYQEF